MKKILNLELESEFKKSLAEKSITFEEKIIYQIMEKINQKVYPETTIYNRDIEIKKTKNKNGNTSFTINFIPHKYKLPL